LNITEQVYTQHLAISAKSVYFVNALSTAPASMISLVPRLVIDELPAHALAIVMTLIGFLALFIHIVHSRHRRRFFLAASPGSIAHIISITAHARFGEKLYPYDDDETLARKLAGLSFSLDPRTGAVVADRDVGPVASPPVGFVTPYNLSLSPRPSTGTLSGSSDTFTGAYADEERPRHSRTRSSILLDVKHAARSSGGSYSRSEGSSTPAASRRSFGELELEESGQQLPTYVDDLESQSSRGLTPPSVSEKRLRIDTARARRSMAQSQGESLPLLR